MVLWAEKLLFCLREETTHNTTVVNIVCCYKEIEINILYLKYIFLS